MIAIEKQKREREKEELGREEKFERKFFELRNNFLA